MPSISEILGPKGLIARHLQGFEYRETQQEMAEAIDKAFSEEKIALIEAGTGIGKTIAYLVPALLHAATNHKRCVISTHTIPLQEQLVHRDIPLLINALGFDLEVVLLKGARHYLCLRSLEEADLDGDELMIQDWATSTKEGVLNELGKDLSFPKRDQLG
ncbi:unnamed protein product, partial [marine sediment metagenome]